MTKRKKEWMKATLANTFIAVSALVGTGAVGYGTAELVESTMEHHTKQMTGEEVNAGSGRVKNTTKPVV